MATYLQAYGDLMVSTNQWDPSVLERFRANELVSNFKGSLDQNATFDELQQVAELIPEEWLASSATGSADQCVDAVNHQFELGCDGVILHGASPSDLEPIVTAYSKHRDAARFAGLPANPALAKRFNN